MYEASNPVGFEVGARLLSDLQMGPVGVYAEVEAGALVGLTSQPVYGDQVDGDGLVHYAGQELLGRTGPH